MRDQPGFPCSLAAENAQGCLRRPASQKRLDLRDQTHSLACWTVCLVERRQRFAKLERCRLSAGEGRRKPGRVLAPRDLRAYQRFTEVATKLPGAGIEVTRTYLKIEIGVELS